MVSVVTKTGVVCNVNIETVLEIFY
jgi:hypothetical protein